MAYPVCDTASTQFDNGSGLVRGCHTSRCHRLNLDNSRGGPVIGELCLPGHTMDGSSDELE